jgi:hypothetical protein
MHKIQKAINDLWEEHSHFKDKQRSWLNQMGETQRLAALFRKCFHQWRPLSAYVRAGSSGGEGSFGLSLRFFGQEVARLTRRNGEIHLSISGKTAQTNKQFFPELSVGQGRYPWNSTKERDGEAKKFRRFFRDKTSSSFRLHSPEHAVESRFIREMSSKSSTKFNGMFSGIQPVTIAGFPLQVPLPISGSSGSPKAKPGHIDILARRRTGKVYLSVWELKAPGAYKHALLQVYIYAATLLKMLRDPDYGQKWYRMFGFSGNLPKALRIEAVIAITKDQQAKLHIERENNKDLPLQIGNDRIDLFVAYYDRDTLRLDYEKIEL